MKRSIRKNAAFAVCEVITSGLGLFFIYRSVVLTLGIDMLGVWSLLLAATALGRLADVGIAAGLAKFVAEADSRSEPESLSSYIVTALLTIAMLMGTVALIAWFPINILLSKSLSGTSLAIATKALPWTLVTFVLLNLNAVLAAALLGLQRVDLRFTSNFLGLLVQIGLSLLLVKEHGIMALAWAQAAQYTVGILIASIFLLNSKAVGRKIRVSRSVFSEITAFGAKLQVGTVANVIFESGSKFVLGHTLGTAALGLFEMTYRMVYQVRGVAIFPLQNLVPVFAAIPGDQHDKKRALFEKSNTIAALVGGGLMGSIALASPLASWLWLKKIDPDFVVFSSMMCVCWSVNIFAAPSYFWGIANNQLRPNILGQIFSAIAAPSLGYVLGISMGGGFAVAGVLAGKLVGDAIPGLLSNPGNSIKSAALVQKNQLISVFVVLLLAIVSASYFG